MHQEGCVVKVSINELVLNFNLNFALENVILANDDASIRSRFVDKNLEVDVKVFGVS